MNELHRVLCLVNELAIFLRLRKQPIEDKVLQAFPYAVIHNEDISYEEAQVCIVALPELYGRLPPKLYKLDKKHDFQLLRRAVENDRSMLQHAYHIQTIPTDLLALALDHERNWHLLLNGWDLYVNDRFQKEQPLAYQVAMNIKALGVGYVEACALYNAHGNLSGSEPFSAGDELALPDAF